GAGLRDMLRATRGKLAEALEAEPPKRFVVYLDQGEELYTRADDDQAYRFSELVAEAAGHESFSVLLSLRSNYYPAHRNDRAVFDPSERVDVLALRRDVLNEVICKPARSDRRGRSDGAAAEAPRRRSRPGREALHSRYPRRGAPCLGAR